MWKSLIPLPLLLSTILCMGQPWVEVETPLNFVTDIAFHNDQYHIVGSEGARIYYASSADGGSTWTTRDLTDITKVMGVPMCVGFYDGANGIIGLKGSFAQEYLVTDDGGESWTPVPMILDTSCHSLLQPNDIYLLNDSSAIINGFQSGRYMVTRNGGETWSCSEEFGTSWVPEIHIKSDSTWYTKDNNGFYITHDAGHTWNQVMGKEFVHFQCTDEGEILALSSHYNEPHGSPVLYRTFNEWASYDSIPLHYFNEVYTTLFVQTNHAGLYVIAGEHIYYSENGVDGFAFVQSLDQEQFRVTYINDNWYLSGRGLVKLYDPLSSQGSQPGDQKGIVFPNPATNYIQVELPENYSRGQLMLYNSSGNLCLDTGVTSTQRVNVSQLQNGIYFLVIQSKGSVILSEKLIFTD